MLKSGVGWEGSSLTSTPLSREWQPSTTGGRVRNGMLLKSMNQTCRGAPGCLQWNSEMRSGAWMLSQGSQELYSTLNPSHLTRYHSFWLIILLPRIFSTIHSSTPFTISGSGGGWRQHLGIGSSSAGVNLTTLKTGCNLLMDGERHRRYALFPTLLTIGKGPNLWWESFCEGLCGYR